MNPRRQKLCIGVVAVAFLLGAWFAIGGMYGAFALFYGHNPLNLTPATRARLEETGARAERVIDALTRFHAERGLYPDSLADLVPTYLIELPQPTLGRRQWEYTLDPTKGFVLKYFIGPLYEIAWYEGTAGQWFVDM